MTCLRSLSSWQHRAPDFHLSRLPLRLRKGQEVLWMGWDRRALTTGSRGLASPCARTKAFPGPSLLLSMPFHSLRPLGSPPHLPHPSRAQGNHRTFLIVSHTEAPSISRQALRRRSGCSPPSRAAPGPEAQPLSETTHWAPHGSVFPSGPA